MDSEEEDGHDTPTSTSASSPGHHKQRRIIHYCDTPLSQAETPMCMDDSIENTPTASPGIERVSSAMFAEKGHDGKRFSHVIMVVEKGHGDPAVSMVAKNGRDGKRLSHALELIEAGAFDSVVVGQGEVAAAESPAELGRQKKLMLCLSSALVVFDWASDIMVLVSFAQQEGSSTRRIGGMAVILVIPALCMSLRDWLFPTPGETTKLWFIFKLGMNLTQLRAVFEVSRSFRIKQVTIEYTMLQTLLALLNSFPQVPPARVDSCTSAQPCPHARAGPMQVILQTQYLLRHIADDGDYFTNNPAEAWVSHLRPAPRIGLHVGARILHRTGNRSATCGVALAMVRRRAVTEPPCLLRPCSSLGPL